MQRVYQQCRRTWTERLAGGPQMRTHVTRRTLIRSLGVGAVSASAAAVLAACGETQVVTVEKVVEKEVPVEKTVVKEVPVETVGDEGSRQGSSG